MTVEIETVGDGLRVFRDVHEIREMRGARAGGVVLRRRLRIIIDSPAFGVSDIDVRDVKDVRVRFEGA